MGRVTVKTVAEAVGVSPSTVSNAYNRPDQLSPVLRARILSVAETLGYPGPHAAARMLRRGRAGAVGVLLTERLSYAFSDPYAVGFLTGLSEVVEETGTSIVLVPISLVGDEPDITAVRQASIDALTTLCVADSHPASLLAKVRGIPLVSTMVEPDPAATFVAIDDVAAGALVGSHLAGLGHRSVAVVVDTNAPAGGPVRRLSPAEVTCTDCADRLRGLAATLGEDALVVLSAGHNAAASGRAAAEHLLSGTVGVTAVVATSDVLALGVLDAVAGHGLSAPRDLSVCGFDDVAAAAEAGLTTVRQPIAEKGRRVAELLLDLSLPERRVLLPIELVARRTTGPVPVPARVASAGPGRRPTAG